MRDILPAGSTICCSRYKIKLKMGLVVFNTFIVIAQMILIRALRSEYRHFQ